MAVISSPRSALRRRRILARIVGASCDLRIGEALWAYVFLLPWLLGLLLFWAGPILASFYFSFTRYDVMSPPAFIGLENYSSRTSWCGPRFGARSPSLPRSCHWV